MNFTSKILMLLAQPISFLLVLNAQIICCWRFGAVWWPRKGTVPLRSHAGCTMRPKWLPGVLGFHWATLSWGYKYCWLVLQVGGRATGRQPVTVRELTVRIHKLWSHNSHTEWNRLWQWEVINEMRLATWNVQRRSNEWTGQKKGINMKQIYVCFARNCTDKERKRKKKEFCDSMLWT